MNCRLMVVLNELGSWETMVSYLSQNIVPDVRSEALLYQRNSD